MKNKLICGVSICLVFLSSLVNLISPCFQYLLIPFESTVGRKEQLLSVWKAKQLNLESDGKWSEKQCRPFLELENCFTDLVQNSDRTGSGRTQIPCFKSCFVQTVFPGILLSGSEFPDVLDS